MIIGKGGTSVASRGATGNSGGTTIVGKNFITATGGCNGTAAYYNISSRTGYSGSGGAGGVGGNLGLATDEHPGLAKGGNGYAGSGISGNGGDAGGDTSRGGSGGMGQGSHSSGKAGRGFGADGAVLIRLWKD
ncbi:hypothetical protein [Bartonella tribocorum]|uniref:hypothetical protein n=1 Tax=Bartonella tribocorum TaxID=85701 RepID=UPI003CC77E1A